MCNPLQTFHASAISSRNCSGVVTPFMYRATAVMISNMIHLLRLPGLGDADADLAIQWAPWQLVELDGFAQVLAGNASGITVYVDGDAEGFHFGGQSPGCCFIHLDGARYDNLHWQVASALDVPGDGVSDALVGIFGVKDGGFHQGLLLARFSVLSCLSCLSCLALTLAI